jgi:hypothetical protein
MGYAPTGYAPSGYAVGSPMGAGQRGSGRATASLILGIVGILLCFTIVVPVLAIIFGVMARKEINRSQGTVTGGGKATAGLVLGIVGLVLGALIIVAAAFGSNHTDLADVEVGMCINVPDGNTVSHVTKKSCTSPHDAEVFSTPKIDRPAGAPWPGLAEFQSLATEACQADLQAYVGADQVDSLTENFIYPGEKSWEQNNDRRLICFVQDPSGQVSKSLRATG